MGWGGDESICVEVVRAIANYEGVPPSELGFALDDHVDTDTLEALSRDRSTTWVVGFRVPGHAVTVCSDRTIVVDDYEYENPR